MRRNLAPRILLAQTLLYSAGVLVCLSLILWGNASRLILDSRVVAVRMVYTHHILCPTP